MAPLKLRQDWKIWYRRVVQLCLIQKPSAEIFKSLQKKEEKIDSAPETPKIILHLIWRVARSELCPLGMQAAPGSIPMSGTFFGHEKIIYGHPPSSADSSWAVVSYWRKNVH